MYIVTRAFRDANGFFKVGSIVGPTNVKAFKSRLQQRHIVNVDEQNIDKWAQYFLNRHGIDLSEALKDYLSKPSTPENPEEPEEPKEPEESEATKTVSLEEADSGLIEGTW